VLTYNFQGTNILGASHGHLCDSKAFLFISEKASDTSSFHDFFCVGK